MVLAKLFGTKSDREVKKLRPSIDRINQLFANDNENYQVSFNRENQNVCVLLQLNQFEQNQRSNESFANDDENYQVSFRENQMYVCCW